MEIETISRWLLEYPLGNQDALALLLTVALAVLVESMIVLWQLGRRRYVWPSLPVALFLLISILRTEWPPPGPPLTPFSVLAVGAMIWWCWELALGHAIAERRAKRRAKKAHTPPRRWTQGADKLRP